MSFKPTPEELNEYLAYKSPQDFYDSMDNGIKSLEQLDIEYQENTILVCGGMAAFDKGLMNFLNEYAKYQQKRGCRVVLLSEVTAEYRRYTAMKAEFPFLCTPHLLAKEMIVLGMDIELNDEIQRKIRKNRFLKQNVKLVKERHLNVGKGYAEAWVYYANCYIEKLLDYIKPSKVILWNQFYAFHRIFDTICKRRKIDVEYMEFGCLPGTIEFDKNGQMGESEVTKKYKRFRKQEVTIEEYREMVEILRYLKQSGLNRNVQPNIVLKSQQLYRYNCKFPTIVYFGQNDYESGLRPYDIKAKIYHSPIFKSTVQAMEYLIRLSIKNRWNFIYKPHPIMEALGLETKDEQNSNSKYMLSNVNLNELIDFADVIVTIFSQSAYISLIRNKPVVMMGYMQLRGKGCTYEAYKKCVIEGQIKRALKNGVTEEQRENFIKHCAQLKKYHLVDDLCEKDMQVGRMCMMMEDEDGAKY